MRSEWGAGVLNEGSGGRALRMEEWQTDPWQYQTLQNSEILLEFKITLFLCDCIVTCNLLLWSKLYFQHHYASLQCHMIFRNHNNILLKKHFWLLLSMLSCAAQYFCGNWYILFFGIFWWIESSKEQHLINLIHPCWIKVFISLKKKNILLNRNACFW